MTIWRRIQVPETYNFWDLHVAIQDAMGWLGQKYDPDKFTPQEIKLDDPKARWRSAFSN